MILFFTGTGNSEYIARALGERLSDMVISINECMKREEKGDFSSDKPYVIVAPVYAWRMAGVVTSFLEQTRFSGNRKLYFVLTMGGSFGKAGAYCRKLCEKIGMEYMGTHGVVMPDNYINMSSMPEEAEADRVIAAAMETLPETVVKIMHQEPFPDEDSGALGGLLSGPINAMFTKSLSDKSFRVSDDCITCGICIKNCPLNNITMEGLKPVFHGNCTNCYACIQRCPKQAINIKNRTVGKKRYVCPKYPAE